MENSYHTKCKCGYETDLPLDWSNTTCDNCGRTLPGQAKEWTNDDLSDILTIAQDYPVVYKMYCAWRSEVAGIKADLRDIIGEEKWNQMIKDQSKNS